MAPLGRLDQQLAPHLSPFSPRPASRRKGPFQSSQGKPSRGRPKSFPLPVSLDEDLPGARGGSRRGSREEHAGGPPVPGGGGPERHGGPVREGGGHEPGDGGGGGEGGREAGNKALRALPLLREPLLPRAREGEGLREEDPAVRGEGQQDGSGGGHLPPRLLREAQPGGGPGEGGGGLPEDEEGNGEEGMG